jgi:hypothetical protein
LRLDRGYLPVDRSQVEVLKSSGKVPALANEGVRLHGPGRITARVRDGDIDVQVDIAYMKTEGRYVVQAVRGTNLTSEVLHTLRPPEIIREAVLDAIFGSREGRKPITDDEWAQAFAGGRPATVADVELAQAVSKVEAFIRARLRGEPASPPATMDDATKVRVIAFVYQFAYKVGQRPTATVARAFDLPRSTAGRLIRQARDQGLLGPTTERKAGV